VWLNRVYPQALLRYYSGHRGVQNTPTGRIPIRNAETADTVVWTASGLSPEALGLPFL